jgi:hypothetical protein
MEDECSCEAFSETYTRAPTPASDWEGIFKGVTAAQRERERPTCHLVEGSRGKKIAAIAIYISGA